MSRVKRRRNTNLANPNVTLEIQSCVWFINSEKDQANRILVVQNALILIAKMSNGLDHVVNYFAMHLDDVVNDMYM